MSSETEGVVEEEPRCSSCGITQGDNIKLMKCTACKLARYCSVACQKEHRPKHKRECKRKAAELREELLFKQPEGTYFGDCPICFLPIPADPKKISFMMCCLKNICRGCAVANDVREIRESLERKCPFCRHPILKSQADVDGCVKKRVESNCPAGMRWLGSHYYSKGDFDSAAKYFAKAVELKEVEAQFDLGVMYKYGRGIEKNEKKANYLLEEAAINGHFAARHFLGWNESSKGNYERAVKHFIIAASHGFDESLDTLRKLYWGGQVTKEDYAAALRAHQAAVEASSSPQREAAKSAKLNRFK